MRINDKPFWQVSVNEARDWITKTTHSTRFMELVVAGLPNDGQPIEHHRKPEEIDALWKLAGEAN